MRKTSLIALTAALLASAPVHAEPAQGWYASLNGGLALTSDQSESDDYIDIEDIGRVPGASAFEFHKGYALDGTVGYDFNPFRVEGELSWRKADVDKGRFSSKGFSVGNITYDSNSTPIEGEYSSLGLMVNGWYDLHTGSRWTPFIGGGIGAARIKSKVKGHFTLLNGDSYRLDGTDTDWQLAYQAGAGLGYKLNESTTLQAQYRYFTTEDAGIEDGVHNMTVGLRYRF